MNSQYSERQRTEKQYHDDKYRESANGPTHGQISLAYTRFWDLVGQPKGLTILDFGCGDGWLSVLMAKRGKIGRASCRERV